jgi:predicted nucleotide-binding protein
MDNPKHVRKPPRAAGSRRPRKVLLIHGRDELNLFRLKEMVRDRFRLAPVLLNEEPGRGHTIIEKWEHQAAIADFAIVLMTPDDVVEFQKKRYPQARPNVLFELGWAYRHLGRARVCILVKKGMHMPSNLQGINRLEFEESVKEVTDKLESELEAAGIIRLPARAS